MFSSESIEFPFLQDLVWPSDVSLPIALGATFLWGALHVMSPGHGKTVVGAYLVGSRATAQHALFLGLTTTISHSAGVFALAILALFASQFILPEQVYPWLSFGSGLIVVILGVSLFIRRWKSLPILKLSPLAEHPHDEEHCHHHHHSHLPAETDRDRVSWSSLLALGISSGLMPCPSALVVLLGAIAIGKIGFGFLMVLAFSLGMAAALTGLGLILVNAKKLFVGLPQPTKLIKMIPAVSALLIALLGLGMTAQAFMEIRY